MRGARIVFGWAWKYAGQRYIRARFGDRPEAKRIVLADAFVLALCILLSLWVVLAPGIVVSLPLIIAGGTDSGRDVAPGLVALIYIIAIAVSLPFWNFVLRVPKPWDVWSIQLPQESKQEVVDKASASTTLVGSILIGLAVLAALTSIPWVIRPEPGWLLERGAPCAIFLILGLIFLHVGRATGRRRGR